MKRDLVLVKLATLFIIVAALALGCGLFKKGKKTTVTKTDIGSSAAKESKPDYEVYAPLPVVMKEITIPMLVDQTGVVETACFKPKEKMNTATASMEVKAAIQKYPKYLNKVIGRWLIEDVGVSGLSEDDVAGWTVTVEYPVMVEMDPTSLRFVDEQECVGEKGWLEDGVHAVVSLIGARNFKFETAKRLDLSLQDSLAESLKDRGLTMEGRDMDLYKPVLDDEGAQKYDSNEEALYTGPGGVNITEKDLPPESERGIKEWNIKSEEPLYFAFQELPHDAWQKESKKKACNVFLVWGDVKPRSPDCPEFSGVTFTVEKKDDETLNVEVTIDEDTKKLEVSYEMTQRVMMANRAILWINAKKEEEGVTIRLNSLVIGELFPNKD